MIGSEQHVALIRALCLFILGLNERSKNRVAESASAMRLERGEH